MEHGSNLSSNQTIHKKKVPPLRKKTSLDKGDISSISEKESGIDSNCDLEEPGELDTFVMIPTVKPNRSRVF